MKMKKRTIASPYDDPNLIPAEYAKHIIRIDGNDIWFLIDGRIRIAKNVSVWREDVERLWPQKDH